MSWLKDMTPDHIQRLVPYASARREASHGEIWLNANENPYECVTPEGLSPLNRYPDFQPSALVEGYAGYAGVTKDQVLVTRGIDEGIDLLLRTFCLPGVDSISYTPPTYGMYKISAEVCNVALKTVPLMKDLSLDLDGVMAAGETSKLIFLCSPNNPTGSLVQREELRRVLEATRGTSLVVVDEAYIEFKPEASAIALLSEYPNLIILRTLSKAFGLAGLRCGFILASPEMIGVLQKVSAPYPIPGPVVDIASEALKEAGIICMMRDVEILVKDRERLKDLLGSLSCVKKVYPSEANFVLFQVDDAPSLKDFLYSRGVVIRDQSSQYGLENTLRITVGTELELQTVYQNMQEYEGCK